MNKSDMIETVQAVLENRKQAEAVVNSILFNIETALAKGDSVALTGFGTFKVAERNARTARNPRTGEPIEIKARKVVKFTAGKKLKEAISSDPPH